MTKKELTVIVDSAEVTSLHVDELCQACHISTRFIQDLIEYDIIHLEGNTQEEWVFNLEQLQRIKTALRLQRDLEVNLAGIALVLNLLDEMETLRAKAEFWEQHYSK